MSTLLSGSETWTLTQQTRQYQKAIQMWMPRKMLKILWIEHKTNNEVLQLAKTTTTLFSTITKRKFKYFRHFIRQTAYRERFWRRK